jgi:hypothetical protein
MQNTKHKDLQNSGIYNKPFFTKKYLSINDIDFDDIKFNEKLHRKYRCDEAELYDLFEDDIEDIIREDIYDSIALYNYHRQVDEFDFNEENAYECDLIPFSVYCADEDKDIHLLAFGGCGTDLSPRFDAYFFLETGKIDPASTYFSNKEYFKSLVPTKIFKAINEKFGGVKV